MECSNIVLSRESNQNLIKDYFVYVRGMIKSEDEFPINLENVWALAYSSKSKAVRALKNTFIQDIDYQVLTQNGQNYSAGRPIEEYHLTVSCLEHFIARKVRSVFEIYRKVFHGAMNAIEEYKSSLPTTFSEALRQLADQVEINEKQKSLISSQNLMIADLNKTVEQQNENLSYYYMILNNPSTITITQIAQDYGMSGKKMNALLRDMKIQHKVNNQWILYSKYLGEGYVQSRQFTPQTNNGSNIVVSNTEWTQKGRLFLYNELKKSGIIPSIENKELFQ